MKIRSQFQVRRKNGEYLGAFAPYGYMKSQDDHTKLEIDPYAAGVVQDIFRWKIEGWEIAAAAPGPGQKDVQASSPARKAISSPATLIAISAGVSAPMARPMGAWTRSVSSFVSPASHMSSFDFAIFFRLPITPT